jgi:hypothetical protein
MSAITNSPALTGLPEAFEKIFSVIVRLSAVIGWMYRGGNIIKLLQHG